MTASSFCIYKGMIDDLDDDTDRNKASHKKKKEPSSREFTGQP